MKPLAAALVALSVAGMPSCETRPSDSADNVLNGNSSSNGNFNTRDNANDNGAPFAAEDCDGSTSLQPPAFPGAEGFGACATGGRGGQVIYVTNLDPSGPGSFQEAINTPGPRYILFKVSGMIDGEVQLTHGDATIAGQTSPGGIIVRGFHTTEEPYCDQGEGCTQPQQFAENWIMRHIRTRPGAGRFDDGLRLRYTRRAIVDHLSIANATDEAVEISLSNTLTVQNCQLAETLGGHAVYGGMLLNYSNPDAGFELTRLSIHHNTWNRIQGRMPEMSRESPAAAGSTMQIELSNNLLWDAGYFIDVARTTAVAGDEPIYYQLNWVGNYAYIRSDFPYGMIWLPLNDPNLTTTYFSDNRMNLYADRQDYQLIYCCNDFPEQTPSSEIPGYARTMRHEFPSITYLASADLRGYATANVGAFPRDPMDRRLLGPVESGVIDENPRDVNPYDDAYDLDFDPGSPPSAPTDSDDDGMPDDWETAHGLNPGVQDHNGAELSVSLTGVAGYTNLECYLNELADGLVAGNR